MIFDDDGNIIGQKPWSFEASDHINYQFDEIVHETPKAWLVEVGWKKAWFPKDWCWFEEKIMTAPNWFKPTFTDL